MAHAIGECPLCLGDMEEAVTLQACGHTYHRECITNVHASDPFCPVCRVPFGLESIIKLYVDPSEMTQRVQQLEAQLQAAQERVNQLLERQARINEKAQATKRSRRENPVMNVEKMVRFIPDNLHSDSDDEDFTPHRKTKRN